MKVDVKVDAKVVLMETLMVACWVVEKVDP